MNIFEIVFPKLCVGCGKEGGYVCGECLRQLRVPEPSCPMCGLASLEGFTHARCKRRDGLDRLVVGLGYKGLIQKSLKKIKYRNAWEILGEIFQLATFPNFENCLVVPVPMWGPKERERGFNQAVIIAELIHKYCCRNSELREVVERGRRTRPMYGLKRKDRMANVKSAFRMREKVGVWIGGEIVLVDDVWTTGATMRECAKVLKRAGAKSVCGIALAR